MLAAVVLDGNVPLSPIQVAFEAFALNQPLRPNLDARVELGKVQAVSADHPRQAQGHDQVRLHRRCRRVRNEAQRSQRLVRPDAAARLLDEAPERAHVGQRRAFPKTSLVVIVRISRAQEAAVPNKLDQRQLCRHLHEGPLGRAYVQPVAQPNERSSRKTGTPHVAHGVARPHAIVCLSDHDVRRCPKRIQLSIRIPHTNAADRMGARGRENRQRIAHAPVLVGRSISDVYAHGCSIPGERTNG